MSNFLIFLILAPVAVGAGLVASWASRSRKMSWHWPLLRRRYEVRTDLPALGTMWRDRHLPKRTVRVTGVDDRVLSITLTDETGETPASVMTNFTVPALWDWMYEPAGLGART